MLPEKPSEVMSATSRTHSPAPTSSAATTPTSASDGPPRRQHDAPEHREPERGQPEPRRPAVIIVWNCSSTARTGSSANAGLFERGFWARCIARSGSPEPHHSGRNQSAGRAT